MNFAVRPQAIEVHLTRAAAAAPAAPCRPAGAGYALAMARAAFYSGSFDPLTNGHLDVIVGAAAFCDRLTVGVGTNPNKAALFSAEERLALILDAARPALAGTGCALDVVAFSGLAIEAARAAGATLIVRGLRNSTDFDFEMQMAGMNRAMAPEIRTVFCPPPRRCGRSRRPWCGRSPPWAATSPPSRRPTSWRR